MAIQDSTENLKLRATTLGALFLMLPALSSAADADAGAAKAEPCLGCHFPDDFKGESEADVLSLIAATRAAGAKHPPDDRQLSQADLEDIAAFFARGE